jgi:ribonuclease P protein component
MTRRAEFSHVRTAGESRAGRFLVLSTLADPALPHLKVAFITTRKVGKAHERNLIRRRLRAVIRAHASELIDPLRFVVTIARFGAAKASFAELEAEWVKQARRLKIIAPASP